MEAPFGPFGSFGRHPRPRLREHIIAQAEVELVPVRASPLLTESTPAQTTPQHIAAGTYEMTIAKKNHKGLESTDDMQMREMTTEAMRIKQEIRLFRPRFHVNDPIHPLRRRTKVTQDQTFPC